MDDRLLVEALRERDPGAPAAVYDAHADRLYAYCWFQLRSRDAAQVALRETFIMAEAHIGKLRDPGRFAPWLYALARLECARRLPPKDHPPDVSVARHDQEDVDQRIMAWQTVLALRPLSREVLELHLRHGLSMPDLAAVLDVPLKDTLSSLESARGELEEALTAEVLAYQGPYGCAERATLLRERHGVHGHDINGRLMGHARECSICGAIRPRTVSAAKVYGLLPDVKPAAVLRLRVMSCFHDPELVGYKLFVASRVTEFTPEGFPVQSVRPRRSHKAPSPGRQSWLRRLRRTRSSSEKSRPRAQAVRVALVFAMVGLLSGGGVAPMYEFLGTGRQNADSVAGPRPTAVPGLPQRPPPKWWSADHPDGTGHFGVAPVSATFPLGSKGLPVPPIALLTPPLASAAANTPSGPEGGLAFPTGTPSRSQTKAPSSPEPPSSESPDGPPPSSTEPEPPPSTEPQPPAESSPPATTESPSLDATSSP